MAADKFAIVVTVADQWMNRFVAIKKQLQALGMHVNKEMPKLGVISGTTSNPAKMRSVEGVESVNIESSHVLPPKTAKIQ